MEKFKTTPDESIFLDLTPEDVVFLFFYLGIAISQSLTINELNVIANGLFETAQVLFTISAQRKLINGCIEEQQKQQEKEKEKQTKPSKPEQSEQETTVRDLSAIIKNLQMQVAHLQEQIDELKSTPNRLQ